MSEVVPFAVRRCTIRWPERLRSLIFDRQLAPGDFIDEVRCPNAGRSATATLPARDASRCSSPEGLVEPVPRRGRRVIEMTATDADELFDHGDAGRALRLRRATQHATDADLRAAPTTTSWSEPRRRGRLHQANHGFHGFVQRLPATAGSIA